MGKKIELPPCKWHEGESICSHKDIMCDDVNCTIAGQADCIYYEPFGGFDAVAAAIREAGLFYELKDPYEANETRAEIITHPRFRGWNGIMGQAKGPTAALIATCLKYNAEASHE